MKCPNCKASQLSELHVGGTVAHVCKECHGLLFNMSELEALKDNIQDHGWFDISLWEKKELINSAPTEHVCPVCQTMMHGIDWNHGELLSSLCSSCGSMWIPKGEYQKAIRYIKECADEEVLQNYGALLEHEIEEITLGQKPIRDEMHHVASLVRFFEYRFMVKHPLLTELIEELPFTK